MTNHKDNQAYLNHIPTLSWAKFFDTIGQIKLVNNWVENEDMSTEKYDELMEVNAKSFIKVMHEYKLMVDFNWVDWKEGEPLIYKGEFEQFDTNTLFKMLTFIIKFDSGKLDYLVIKFKDNTILEIMTILERRICNN